MINYSGKEMKKNVYITESFARQQKYTHSKSTISQWNKFLKNFNSGLLFIHQAFIRYRWLAETLMAIYMVFPLNCEETWHRQNESKWVRLRLVREPALKQRKLQPQGESALRRHGSWSEYWAVRSHWLIHRLEEHSGKVGKSNKNPHSFIQQLYVNVYHLQITEFKENARFTEQRL